MPQNIAITRRALVSQSNPKILLHYHFFFSKSKASIPSLIKEAETIYNIKAKEMKD
jgi:hypothetical protein